MLEVRIDADGARTYWIDGIETDQETIFAERDRLAAEEEAQRAEVIRPLVPLPIAGATVEEVKASADASIADLAEQMNARLALLTEGA